MYSGYNLRNVSYADFSSYYDVGLSVHGGNKRAVKASLESIVNNDGSIYASKITNDWFPGVKADVFISHSHKDSATAIGLAGWLKDKFGLNTFVDSCVWGHSDLLLKILDKKYCWQEETETYNYNKRNKTTSHVNIILSTALAGMIDASECVIFLNTPASISCEGYVAKEGTESPWIYSELAITKIIERRCGRSRPLKKALEARAMDEAMKIKYDADLSHLIRIEKEDLNRWLTKNRQLGSQSLDTLYDITGY